MTFFVRALALNGIAALTLSAASITVGVNNGGNAFPFGGPAFGLGTHYQEAYDSSLFSGPISITGLDFFRSGAGNLYAGTYQLSLSTISAAVSSLWGSSFATLGGDNTVFSTVALSGAAPSILSFTGNPFLYIPANGNLLLDIVISNPVGGSETSYFQDVGPGPATIARHHDFGTVFLGHGLVTQFDFGAGIPEPGTLGLLGLGLAGLAIHGRRRA